MVMKWLKSLTEVNEVAKQRDEERAPQEEAPQPDLKTRVFSTRDFSLAIVGESHYQPALAKAKKGVKDSRARATSQRFLRESRKTNTTGTP